MRRLLLLTAAAAIALGNTGCLLNIWSGDPAVRMEQLMIVSENERMIQDEWRRIWFTDQPSHLSPMRTDGGIGP